jgi:hypothetical protein
LRDQEVVQPGEAKSAALCPGLFLSSVIMLKLMLETGVHP